MRPAWAEIDLAAFRRNVAAIRAMLPEGAQLVAVLKADAYGHGAVELARCLDERTAMIAVALLEEAVQLRDAGITHPILVLGALSEEQIAMAAERGIEVAAPSPEALRAACEVARHNDVKLHLKLDSGMGRMGLIESDLAEAISLIRATPRLELRGIYTHFANAPEPKDPYTLTQIATFDRLLAGLREAGVDAPLHHLANSAATVRHLVRPGEWARVGIALFGAETLDDHSQRLEPVLRWRTEVVRVKTLPPDSPVGYGLTFRTQRESRIATIAIGYADGYNRLLSNSGEVLVLGRRSKIVGRVSMDLVTIDVTDIDGVSVGDEVVLLGRQGDEEISAEEIAGRLGTISYEVLCSVGARVPRIYRDGEAIVAIRSRFTT
jgi:alanine racemase